MQGLATASVSPDFQNVLVLSAAAFAGVAIAVLFIQRVMYYLKRSRMEMYLHPTI